MPLFPAKHISYGHFDNIEFNLEEPKEIQIMMTIGSSLFDTKEVSKLSQAHPRLNITCPCHVDFFTENTLVRAEEDVGKQSVRSNANCFDFKGGHPHDRMDWGGAAKTKHMIH